MTATADTPAVPASTAPTGSHPTLDEQLDALRAQLLAPVDAEQAHAARVDRTLAYVADTVELRTPAERLLAAEVARLRGVVDDGSLDLAHLITQCLAVLGHWCDDDPGAPVHRKRDRLRALVAGAGFDGHQLAAELNEMAERLGGVSR